MQRLEITGNTPEELYFNCIKTLSMLLQGSATVTPTSQSEAASTEEAVSVATPETATGPSVDAAPLDGEIIPPKKRGRQKADKIELPSDPLPESMSAPELTLDGDIRPMCQAIQAACIKRGMKMPECVEYIQKLYAPFGIGHVKELDPKHFVEFMDAAEAYLNGTA